MHHSNYSMFRNIIFFIFCTLWVCLYASPLPEEKRSSTLKLVHVIFRHGNRNPDPANLYSGDPYANESYYKEGYGQLTNEGKVTAYNLGKALRRRYDKFLSDTWNIKYLNARSSDFNRTKMSLELVLAALYPPRRSQRWSFLDWQPIPYNYLPLEFDKELHAEGECYINYVRLLVNLLKTPQISNYLKRYDEAIKFVNLHINNSDYATLASLYFGLKTQQELGYPLESWIPTVFPEPSHSAAVDYYYLLTNTTALRRVTVGYLLKQILEDTAAKINGTIQPPERKMFLYSGHDTNVGPMLLALDAVRITDLPPYGSYVLFELHEINQVYGIKLFYQFYKKKTPIAIKLPGCDYFCPYDKFYKLVKDILPESENECYSQYKKKQLSTP